MNSIVQDRAAFVAAEALDYVRGAQDRSQLAIAVDACIKAIEAAGLARQDIDGIAGTGPDPATLQNALGIPAVTWWLDSPLKGSFAPAVLHAVNAVLTGVCTNVLVYHAAYQLPWNTPAAADEPFRRAAGGAGDPPPPETMAGAVGYAAWAGRYLHEFGRTREDLGLVVRNNRSNAVRSDHAVRRDPVTAVDHLAATMIRWPLTRLDMDFGVDGGDAFIITTTERARDLVERPVIVHATAAGMIDQNVESQQPSLHRSGQSVVVSALRAASDLWLDDIDLFYPYDGFSIITLAWIESLGWCGPGEAPDFLRQHWVDAEDRALIDGRIPVNTHGGSLCDGGTQGAGHIREAVRQLAGTAGSNQVEGASSALVLPGGLFFNAHGLVLRSG